MWFCKGRIIQLETWDNRIVCFSLMCSSFMFSCQMDPYAIKMMPGTSVATHISRLRASMMAYMQYPFFKFHSITTIPVGYYSLYRHRPLG